MLPCPCDFSSLLRPALAVSPGSLSHSGDRRGSSSASKAAGPAWGRGFLLAVTHLEKGLEGAADHLSREFCSSCHIQVQVHGVLARELKPWLPPEGWLTRLNQILSSAASPATFQKSSLDICHLYPMSRGNCGESPKPLSVKPVAGILLCFVQEPYRPSGSGIPKSGCRG